MASKASANFWRETCVDFLDGLFGIADGIDQVLALRAQEIVALLGLLEFLHGGGVHRAERFDAVADFVGGLFGFGDGVGIGHGIVRRGQFLHRAVRVPCGWSRRGYFSSACLRTSSTSICERFS